MIPLGNLEGYLVFNVGIGGSIALRILEHNVVCFKDDNLTAVIECSLSGKINASCVEIVGIKSSVCVLDFYVNVVLVIYTVGISRSNDLPLYAADEAGGVLILNVVVIGYGIGIIAVLYHNGLNRGYVRTNCICRKSVCVINNDITVSEVLVSYKLEREGILGISGVYEFEYRGIPLDERIIEAVCLFDAIRDLNALLTKRVVRIGGCKICRSGVRTGLLSCGNVIGYANAFGKVVVVKIGGIFFIIICMICNVPLEAVNTDDGGSDIYLNLLNRSLGNAVSGNGDSTDISAGFKNVLDRNRA